MSASSSAFRDVLAYPPQQLRCLEDGVRVALSYRQSWDDGFGARGWKLDTTIGDPQIIASTRETGERIETSVFVHDIFDHLLSGFGVSGHRSEAMALAQLAARTGSSPEPDYRQMVEEDILLGSINGEALRSFLPEVLLQCLPDSDEISDRRVMEILVEKLGKEALQEALVAHFFELGRQGEQHARRSWQALGLMQELRSELALCTQELLSVMDRRLENEHTEQAVGHIDIGNRRITLCIDGGCRSARLQG